MKGLRNVCDNKKLNITNYNLRWWSYGYCKGIFCTKTTMKELLNTINQIETIQSQVNSLEKITNIIYKWNEKNGFTAIRTSQDQNQMN